MLEDSLSRYGRAARLLCSVLLGATPAALALYWFVTGAPSLSSAWISDPLVPVAIAPAQRLAAATTSLIALVPALWAIARARQLAGRFERRLHFTAAGVAAAAALARSLFWFAAGQSLVQTAIPLALTWGNPTGHRILAFSLDWGAVMAFALGMIVMLLARALDHGRALAEDAALTV